MKKKRKLKAILCIIVILIIIISQIMTSYAMGAEIALILGIAPEAVLANSTYFDSSRINNVYAASSVYFGNRLL